MLLLSHFNSFYWCILSFTDEKRSKFLKFIKVFNFEGVWNELFAKNVFHIQSNANIIGILKEQDKKYKLSKKLVIRFLPFFKIGDQNSSFSMETGN